MAERALPEAFFAAVCRANAELTASWMAAGFVHGVLNSDNVNLTGESFDYGPYRFLPRFDPLFTAAYFDHSGLYAYGRQPATMRWNLEQLGRALSPILSEARARVVLERFDTELASALAERLLERLGLGGRAHDDFVRRCFDFLEGSPVGFDDFFFDWYGGEASKGRALAGPRREHYRGEAFESLRHSWEGRPPLAPEMLRHPYFQRTDPCRLLIDDIEQLWSAIAQRDDWTPLADKLAAIRELATAHGRDMVPPR